MIHLPVLLNGESGGVFKHMTSVKSGPFYRPTTLGRNIFHVTETYCAEPNFLTDKVKLVFILKFSLQGKAALSIHLAKTLRGCGSLSETAILLHKGLNYSKLTPQTEGVGSQTGKCIL